MNTNFTLLIASLVFTSCILPICGLAASNFSYTSEYLWSTDIVSQNSSQFLILDYTEDKYDTILDAVATFYSSWRFTLIIILTITPEEHEKITGLKGDFSSWDASDFWKNYLSTAYDYVDDYF